MNVLVKGQILQTRHGFVSSLNFEAKLQVLKKDKKYPIDLFGLDFMIKINLPREIKNIFLSLKKPQNKRKFPKRFLIQVHIVLHCYLVVSFFFFCISKINVTSTIKIQQQIKSCSLNKNITKTEMQCTVI